MWDYLNQGLVLTVNDNASKLFPFFSCGHVKCNRKLVLRLWLMCDDDIFISGAKSCGAGAAVCTGQGSAQRANSDCTACTLEHAHDKTAILWN